MSVFSNQSADRLPGAGVTAVLGPTNTGKTHLAIERMVAHSSGIIGLPLRLLAREVYNKVAARVGEASVALITGEEKIKPPRARFWVSTVEAMPRDLDVSFVAIDEIQLATDLERGHVFTDRILNRRGRDETLILGAATMRPVIERLLPGANIVTRPRLSQLEFAGERKITRQPRRTAIVAFSADEVYAIAELIRRQHGGAAVVMGSLSPRTRNAQVEMYQSGDVDYLVATDAIGMGLNLDVDHVAFAGDRKYDGYQYRRLNPTEFAQIAGRAGRATRNGTFGTTGRCPPFEPELVNALQNHTFDNVRTLQWRNARLDFSSIGALQATLAEVPGHDALARAPIAEDSRVLDHCARDAEIRGLAASPAAIERLWEVCQVPDYRKVAPAVHAELAVSLYGFLMRDGAIGADWFAQQVMQADRTDGDIDTLSARIAHIRTWTFVANRPDWLADPEHWQGITRAIEDKLSDALHERLTERFVDRRTSVLMRRLRENNMLETEIGKSGEVIVEGHTIGRLDGFMFAPDAAEAGSDAKALQAAAQKALAGEIDARAEKLSQAGDEQFALTAEGVIRWMGDAVGKLVAADDMLRPRVRILSDEHLSGAPRDAVQARIDKWLEAHIQKLLGPLFDISKAEDITGIARGIAFQLVEALGVIERQKIATEMKDLDQPSRAILRKYGVRFGAYHIYLPALLKPAARSLASLLWALKQDNIDLSVLSTAQHMASSGRTSFAADPSLDRIAYRTLGYRLAGARAVRVDILERLADLIRPALAWRPGSPGAKPPGAFDGRSFTVTQPMTSLTGAAGEDFASILRALGYRLDRCPPLPQAPVNPAQTANATRGNGEMTLAEYAGIPDDTAPSIVAEAAAEPSAETSEAAAPETGAAEASAVEAPATDASATDAATTDEAAEAVAGEAAASDATPADTPSADAAPAAAEPAAPQLIEVWRIGRSEERRPREHSREHSRERHHQARRSEQSSEDGEKQHRGRRRRGRHGGQGDAAGGDANAREHDRERRFQRDRDQNRDAQAQTSDASAGQGENQRGQHGRGRNERHHDGGRKFDNKPSFRGNQGRNPPQRERQADPNSPFAKLAALKEQLAANAKEPRS